MEKPSYYDLLIDLTTSTPSKVTRPTFYSSKPVASSQPGPSRSPTYRLSTIRFAWSDVKLVSKQPPFICHSSDSFHAQWNEIDRILQLDTETAHGSCCSSVGDVSAKPKAATIWPDAWQVYEDVCIICAGLWMGSWRGNSTASYSTAGGAENWGSVRLEGDDDLSLQNMLGGSGSSAANGNGNEIAKAKMSIDSSRTYVRSLGMGIEGRPIDSSGGVTSKSTRRASAVSWSSGKATVVGTTSGNGKTRQASTSTTPGPSAVRHAGEEGELVALTGLGSEQLRDPEEEPRRVSSRVNTTMALLQTFHAHTAFQLSVLRSLLSQQGVKLSYASTNSGGTGVIATTNQVVSLTPKDIVAFQLGPFSSLDARYLEWLAAEYAGDQVSVTVKRGWRDILGAIFGYG